MSLITEATGFTNATAATAVANSIMKKESDVLATVHQILSLRKGLGTPVVSSSVQATILKVQDLVEKSSDSTKRVDWRGNKSNYVRRPATNSSSSSSSSTSSTVPGSHGRSGITGGPPPKYVSRFKTSEKKEDAILLLIQDKLNKFGPPNYEDTYGFMCQILDAGRTDFLKEFMKFVFMKATREENMCPHYAKLLCNLASKYKILLDEMVDKYKEFSAIFEDISEVELTVDDYKALLEANSDKAYRQGYAQFLGELTKYSVLNTDLFVSTFESIVTKIPTIVNADNGKRLMEDYCESMIKILQAIQHERSEIATALRSIVKGKFLDLLLPYTVKGCCDTYKSLSMKARCKMMDITDIVKKF